MKAGATSTLPVTIVRPPLVLIHGLWDNWRTWNNFSPLVDGKWGIDPRFSIGRVDYSYLIGPSIAGSSPAYSPKVIQKAAANSLGFAFNAPGALADVEMWIENFKFGENPMGIPVAAVQADIVGHSMGGDIARYMALQPTYLADDNYAQGTIHKLITIDTPHLGSPLANDFLSPQENGGCVQRLLADQAENFAFNWVTFGGSGAISGAMADLETGSPAIQTMSNALGGAHPLPTALIASVYTNFGYLSGFHGTKESAKGWELYLYCGTVLGDPLALALTPTGWPQLFGNQPNDAIVPENSQLAGLSPSGGLLFTGLVHSAGTENLNFAPPSVLDPDSPTAVIPSSVILLLNAPTTNALYNPLAP